MIHITIDRIDASQRTADASDGVSRAPEYVTDVRWTFRVDGVDTDWTWRLQGAPPIEELTPVRRPTSSERNRHIPVTAYSTTNGGFVELESGLEHDLLRRVDRDPTARRIVSQPFRLSWKAGAVPGGHYPDLLTSYADGTVTVWDARAIEAQDDDFRTKTAVTRAACQAVGWRHEVFSGLGATERLNLLWLHGFRRRPPWIDHVEEQILSAAADSDTTLGNLLSLDDGSGELIAGVWHLLWRGELSIDMGSCWTPATRIAFRDEVLE